MLWLKHFLPNFLVEKINQKSIPFVVVFNHPPKGEELSFRTSNKVKLNSISINGNVVDVKPGGSGFEWVCDSRFFFQWENIVAFPTNQNPGNIIFHNSLPELNSYSTFSDYPHCNLDTDATINASWDFIFNSKISGKNMNNGLYYACYDATNRTFRLASWIWCSAIVVKAILDTEWLYPDSQNDILIEQANLIGNRFLELWNASKTTADGGLVIRWDVSKTSEIGFIPWRAPNDVSIIASYCFIPLYQRFGNVEFLDAAIEIGHWIVKKGMCRNGRLFVGYRDDLNEWDKTWLYVDAGFTTKLFASLFKLTKQQLWSEALNKFNDWFFLNFSRDDGLFHTFWPKRFWQPRNHIFSRGQAWVLDGILSSYEVNPEKKYVDIAYRCCKRLAEMQSSDGSWPYLLHNPASGACNKGTPILAYHFLRLYQLKPHKWLLDSADKALTWCQTVMSKDIQAPLYGGIFSLNTEGSITGSANTSTAFVYSSAYYILAKKLREQLF